MSYDSRQDTIEHIEKVRWYLNEARLELQARANSHDSSKLAPLEKETFDAVTPKLKALTYGSDEYKAALAEMGAALTHHYANNSHHPEHYPNGIAGMNLFDLLEMLCDWKAASERHTDGDYAKSLEINRKRFDISDELMGILTHTATRMGWIE